MILTFAEWFICRLQTLPSPNGSDRIETSWIRTRPASICAALVFRATATLTADKSNPTTLPSGSDVSELPQRLTAAASHVGEWRHSRALRPVCSHQLVIFP